jgi:hypothetical protein
VGVSEGSIIDAIITAHMPRNDTAARQRVPEHMGAQVIDIIQPPGIGMPPIADMDAHQCAVAAALATKINARTAGMPVPGTLAESMLRDIAGPSVPALRRSSHVTNGLVLD